MAIALSNMPAELGRSRYDFSFFDHFSWYISPHHWTSILTDSGTTAVGDTSPGVLVVTPSDGSVADNDQSIVKSTNALFLIASGKSLMGRCNLQYSEASTNKANVFFGFISGLAADFLLDDGAGPATSFSGAAIYKIDGSTVWKCVSSIGSTQTISTSNTTAGGSSYQQLEVQIEAISSTLATASFFVDGIPLIDSTSGREIKHNLTYSGAAQMNIGFGIKNGSTTLETLNVDACGYVGSV